MDGRVNGAKLAYVQDQYACRFHGQGDHLFCIITDRENVRTVAARDFTTKKREKASDTYHYNARHQRSTKCVAVCRSVCMRFFTFFILV